MMKRQRAVENTGAALPYIPEELWVVILYHCGASCVFLGVCHRWTELALRNSDAVLRDWISDENASKRPYDYSTIATWIERLRGLSVCWDTYRAVCCMRRTELYVGRIFASCRVNGVLRCTLVLVANTRDCVYDVLKFEQFRHLVAFRAGVSTANDVICKYTPDSYIQWRSGDTAYKQSIFEVNLRYPYPPRLLANGATVLDEVARNCPMAMITFPPHWKTRDAVALLHQLACKRRAIETLERLLERYKQQAHAAWYAHCERQVTRMREGTDMFKRRQSLCLFDLVRRMTERGFYAYEFQPPANLTPHAVYKHQRAYVCGLVPFIASDYIEKHLPPDICVYRKAGPMTVAFNVGSGVDGVVWPVDYEGHARDRYGVPDDAPHFIQTHGFGALSSLVQYTWVTLIDTAWARETPYLFETVIALMEQFRRDI
jgi:hypothetical protein